jgi:hypothetical protein
VDLFWFFGAGGDGEKEKEIIAKILSKWATGSG